ncbi:MAG: hypothetical protein KGI69_02420 [Patescibacteria group bacterium]|nr:hypothetical protein [Patescibacteria group bacterium]
MNLFSISSLITFFAAIGFGLSLYASDRRSPVISRWFAASIFIAFWSLGLYGVASSSSAHAALWWQYLLDVSAIFIPVSYFSFASELVGAKNLAWRKASYALALALAVFSFSPLFKEGMAPKYDFYWIIPGPAYIIFPAFFTAYVALSIVLFVRAQRRTTDRAKRAQIASALIAAVIGFGGGLTNFFPQVIDAYPFGNYFIILYVFLMAYGVLRYRLFSVKIIAAQIFAGAMVMVFLFNLLQSVADVADWVIKFGMFALSLVFSVFLVRSVYSEVAQRERIQKLAEDLEKANVRLTELDRQKSEFVSFASHQLRAPLTAMKGYSSLLLEGDMGALPAEARAGVERIYDSTSTLAHIVDDYLNVSRIELGTMKYAFETIDLKQLVEDVIGELKPTIDASGLAFSFRAEDTGADYRVTADRDKLKQVIANLIDNSMKYTPSGSVSTALSFDRARHRFVFTVKDTGIGIAPEVLPHLFQKFSRAHNANKTNIKGTGLGLFVAKQMIEAHHGSIRAESPGEGKGSSFIVELEPFAKA